MRALSAFLAPAVLAAATSITFAQAPDCTGISDVHNSDPDLIGELTTLRVAAGLSSPIFVTAAPGDDDRLFIVEQAGRIKILKDGAVLPVPFLDITAVVNTSGTERGLLGLAFHPDYPNNGYFFVYYTALPSGPVPNGALTVARYERSAGNPDLADEDSAEIVIFVPHPTFSNHNAGMIAFSPLDGHLYVGTGDGGSGCDPGAGNGNAQNINSLLGKMLRLQVDSLPYSTANNPFDGAIPGADEIWAVGLRNPWRWSFDRVTGAQYIGDVGQSAFEEVSCTPADSVGGENYGWVHYEGTHGCPTPAPSNCGGTCPPIDHHAPIRDYAIGSGRSVVSGYVYRGCRMGDLRGTYFYSDYYDDFVKTLRTDGDCNNDPPPDPNREFDLEPGGTVFINSIASYGEDNRGELYLVDRGGEIFKIVPELFIMELSGPNATPLTIDADGDFVWEDLEASSGHAWRATKVYRADSSTPGSGPGPFLCIHSESLNRTTWTGGDPDEPAAGQVYYYLVTMVDFDVDETTAGARSDGTLRVVQSGPCNN